MRHLIVTAVVAAAVGGLGAGTASAYCDPKYYPLCVNRCQIPDPRDPLGSLTRVCPD